MNLVTTFYRLTSAKLSGHINFQALPLTSIRYQLSVRLVTYNVNVNVFGGGKSGQAGAIRLGISRILQHMSSDYKAILKHAGMLTRDSREVERKKYGRPGARKQFQFSKR